MLPTILNDSGQSVLIIAYKNISDKILSDISITGNNLPAGANITSAVVGGYDSPSDSDYVAGISYSSSPAVLSELYPGQMFKLYIKIDYLTNIGIDFNQFTLDLTYQRSLISLNNLEAFFEFTEDVNSSTTISSNNALSANVLTSSLHPVISGAGYAMFRNAGDRVNFVLPAMSAISIFLKGIIDENPIDVSILSSGNIEFGIDAARYPYMQIGTLRSTSDYSLYDYNEESIIGVSASDIDNVQFFVNGVSTGANRDAGAVTTVNISSGDPATIGYESGRQFIGDISSVAIYQDYKQAQFHTDYYRKIK